MLSCEEKVSEPITINERILGSWLVISEKKKFNDYSLRENENGITADWGFGPKSSIKLNSDNTFNTNVDVDKVVNPNVGSLPIIVPPDTWILNEKVSETFVTFYSFYEYVGLILRDTTRFQISMDRDDQLILENEKVLIKHKRIN